VFVIWLHVSPNEVGYSVRFRRGHPTGQWKTTRTGVRSEEQASHLLLPVRANAVENALQCDISIPALAAASECVTNNSNDA
jgi:hypothetical protein